MDQISRALLMVGGAAEATDSQFRGVTMLLKGNGTNGAQNNTFVDSSTNNFTITRNGNTTQGTFTPYGANWSNYFDGTGDNLTAPSNAAFGFGTGDFTIEAFANLSSGNIVGIPDGAGDSLICYQGSTSGNGGKANVYYPGVGNFVSTPVTLNSWLHIAITRSAGTLRVFFNGVISGSPTADSKSWPTTSVTIGDYPSGGGNAIGYISNLRILKGTALYTAAFTPPTAPLTAITNTSLLTCQSNRFIDNSSNNFTITKNGDVSVQVFSPFSPTASYTAGTIGGSGYFDGSGDYLTAPSNAALAVGATFTVECWVYRTTGGVIQWLIGNNAGSVDTAWALEIEANNTVYGGGWYTGTQTTLTVPVAAWTHIAMVCNSGTLNIYINGVQSGTAATGLDFTTSAVTYIGQYSGGTRNVTGYISDLRVVKGTAVYTSNFTPPTAPLTAISNTSLLLNFTNAGVIDNAMMNNLETVGNAQISTTQSKFGTGSIYFPGGSSPQSYLYSKTQSNVIGSGDFTIEMFINFTNTDRAGVIEFWSSNSWLEWSINAGSWPISRLVLALGGAYVITSNTSLSTGVFHHVAIVRSGSTVSLYQNGTSVGSTTDSTNLGGTGVIQVGTALAQPMNGYIDDLRITKGHARYTANFTPPDSLPTR